jgi:hypothetical protein
MGLYLDIAKQVEARHSGGPQEESAAIVQEPALCLPQSVPMPCSHARTGVRADGTRVCLSCVAVYINGIWSPQTIMYCATAHVPYDPTPTEGPLRQCRDCPHVWQMPCGCGAVSWQCDWSGAQPVWTCRSCGIGYGADQAQSQGQHPGLCPPSTRVNDLERLTGVWRCPCCKGTRRWRSGYRVGVCTRCHPPADAALVTGWEGEG